MEPKRINSTDKLMKNTRMNANCEWSQGPWLHRFLIPKTEAERKQGAEVAHNDDRME